jgi:hypothetical protein
MSNAKLSLIKKKTFIHDSTLSNINYENLTFKILLLTKETFKIVVLWKNFQNPQILNDSRNINKNLS